MTYSDECEVYIVRDAVWKKAEWNPTVFASVTWSAVLAANSRQGVIPITRSTKRRGRSDCANAVMLVVA